MRDPEPAVLLNRFGDSGLDFVLYFHVEDILWGAYTASDIRFAILRGLSRGERGDALSATRSADAPTSPMK